MSVRAASWVAWAVWGLSVVLLPLSAALLLFNPASSGITDVPGAVGAVVMAALILTFSTVGALIATRQPQNLVGWIMLVAGFALGATVLTSTYVDLSISQPRGRLPGTEWVTWFAQWMWVPGFAPALTFLLLLFPNGRLPSRRWRPVGWLAVAAMVILGSGMAFTPGPFVDYPKVTNPLGFAPLEGSLLEGGGVGWFLLPVSVVLSASSMVVRFRRATGEVRQQIKWFALAAAFAAHTGSHRQALLPKQVRRSQDPRSLLRQAQGRDRPGRIERRPRWGGEGDDAAVARLIVVAS